MPITSSDYPSRATKVEQATAAPGETRDVSPPEPVSGLCERPVRVSTGLVHPCDREAKHKGAHSFKGESE